VKAPNEGGMFRNVLLAEREGFEPSIELPLYHLSRVALSTTQPSLREQGRIIAYAVHLNKKENS
jgi:hypothetical protein